MRLAIDKLTESELTDLKVRIAQRLRFLHETRAHAAMLEFSIGERVCFRLGRRQLLFGVLVRYNRKTVTVVTDTDERWNVDPFILRRVKGNIQKTSSNVFPLLSRR